MENTIKKPHQWVNADGEVLILRFSNLDGTSKNGFQHPMEVGGIVVAPDWDPQNVCGGGIHGWPLGLGLGEGKEPDWHALWQVYSAKPEDVSGELEGGSKCKFKTGTLRFRGAWNDATDFVLSDQIKWVQYASSGAASATGWSGAASATGWSGAASATGWRGAASATGESGAASATGWRGAASATGCSAAAVVTGLDGIAKAGDFGCIALAWLNAPAERIEMRCALTGCVGGLKANTWYRLSEVGDFVEAGE